MKLVFIFLILLVIILDNVTAYFGGARPFNNNPPSNFNSKGRRAAVPDDPSLLQYKLPGVHRFGRAISQPHSLLYQ